VVAEVTDEIAVMYAGRVVERGARDAIFASPRHPYTWGLLRSIPRLDQARGDELLPIPGRPPSLINRPHGCAFHPRCPYVQPDHMRVVPPLQPLPTDASHEVACLLSETQRIALWGALKAGATPEEAREQAGVASAGAPVVAEGGQAG